MSSTVWRVRGVGERGDGGPGCLCWDRHRIDNGTRSTTDRCISFASECAACGQGLRHAAHAYFLLPRAEVPALFHAFASDSGFSSRLVLGFPSHLSPVTPPIVGFLQWIDSCRGSVPLASKILELH